MMLKQLAESPRQGGDRCELLAFILYLCSLKQRTSLAVLTIDSCELLAFILYLCSLKQLHQVNQTLHLSCELLAFILYLCSLKQLCFFLTY